MENTPGRIVKQCTTKSGKSAVIRYPTMEDVTDLWRHINAISAEDTFVTFSGEVVSMEDEEKYLTSELKAIADHTAVKLFCYVDGHFAGVCDIHRHQQKKRRGSHVGVFGLVIGKEYRGDGVGYILAQTTIDEAKRTMDNLRLVILECFASNESAMHLYTKLGFSEVGRLPKALFFHEDYIDEVMMALPLQ